MSSVELKPLSREALENLYDYWFDHDIWPAGKFFVENRTLEDLEQAHDEGTFKAFDVNTETGTSLFAILVLGEQAYLDLHSGSEVEVTIEEGRATLDALLSWAYENTDVKALHKYLDIESSNIHKQFIAWGFEPIDDEEAKGEGWQLYAVQREHFSATLS